MPDQREQPVGLGLVDQSCRLPGKSDGLGREVDITGAALVEDEVQHSHHGENVAGTIETSPADRAPGTADAQRHRALGHDVGLRDLACGELAHGPERRRVSSAPGTTPVGGSLLNRTSS